MLPALPEIAAWIRASEAPPLSLPASGWWHAAQLSAKFAPSGTAPAAAGCLAVQRAAADESCRAMAARGHAVDHVGQRAVALVGEREPHAPTTAGRSPRWAATAGRRRRSGYAQQLARVRLVGLRSPVTITSHWLLPLAS
jgi:hypothetical protein